MARPLCAGANPAEACTERGKSCTYPRAGDCGAAGDCADALLTCLAVQDGGAHWACGQ